MNRKQQLKELVDRFDQYYNSGNFDVSSEATARTWVERLLEIFGWDTTNPLELDQESSISEEALEKMTVIESSHRTPDYAFVKSEELLAYLDAKQINLNLKTCKKSSFQIRSYGWSSGSPCSFISNFRELSIYDSRFKPIKGQSAEVGRVHYFSYKDFVDNFEILEEHLLKENVQNRSLRSMYDDSVEVRGAKSLDQDFAELLGEWRVKLANNIYSKNRSLDIFFIQEQVQVLIDRIVFLRVAEGKNIEPFGELKSLCSKKNGYKKFVSKCNSRYHKKYGGYLFRKKDLLSDVEVDSQLILEFVEQFYYPFPYKFEVIPADLLGNMYEQYLGKRLIVKGKSIVDELKPEYQKTKGAIYTPRYIVDSICKETISKLIPRDTIRSVLKLDIIDPSCGSGSFLLGVYDYLESRVKDIIRTSKNLEKKYDSWYWIDPKRDKIYIKVKAKKHIINSCIYGIDIDPQAVEVSRLSLALKALEDGEREPSVFEFDGLEEIKVLERIGENIKMGNSIVDSTIFEYFPEISSDEKTIENLSVFDWEEAFDNVFSTKGGFDAVVGNPPYVETKHFKKESPYMHKLLTLRKDRAYETAAGGKLDIAMPFIERSWKKLNDKGRLGFIVTNRFFKTDYGKATRSFLSSNSCIERIFDFGELKVFKGRSTYTSILNITKRKQDHLKYIKVKDLNNIEANIDSLYRNPSNWYSFSYTSVGESPWNFAFPDLLKLKESLLKKYPSIKDTTEIDLKVGLQVLWDKVYHIRPVKVTSKFITGTNGFGESLTIENASCRPIICNDSFCAMREPSPSVYGIFPYDIKDGVDIDIRFTEFQNRFPKAAKYLTKYKKKLEDEVNTFDDPERWHLYTRKQNLVSQAKPKLLFPTTIIDTIATVDEVGGLYQDNARVFSLQIDGAKNNDVYWALASVFNSTLFNCLAKITTNPLQEGHVQFNKQFVEPIPLPFERLFSNKKLMKKLSSLGREIQKKMIKLKRPNSSSSERSLRKALEQSWGKVDELVQDDLYKLTLSQKKIIQKYPRKEDRVAYFEKFIERKAS